MRWDGEETRGVGEGA
jgi:hypothetical protein